jgi:hypothetical protein
MNTKYKFFAIRNTATDDIELYGKNIHRNSSIKFGAISPIIITDIEIGERFDPFIRVTDSDAQNLMDELWNIGLRPAGGRGSAGQLDAIKYHLEDMRKLVFK